MGHGKVFHCTKTHNWDSISARGLLLSATREGQSRSRQAIHFVYAGGEVGPQAGTVVLYGRDVFYCQLDYCHLQRRPRALPDSERRDAQLRGRSGEVPVLHAEASS